MSQVLFGNDTALVADFMKKLQSLVTEFGRECKRKKLEVNMTKIKAIRCSKGEGMYREC